MKSIILFSMFVLVGNIIYQTISYQRQLMLDDYYEHVGDSGMSSNVSVPVNGTGKTQVESPMVPETHPNESKWQLDYLSIYCNPYRG